MIIVPLESDFDLKSREEQGEIIEELQMRSRAAGLAGTVVPVWDCGGGRMAFIAPRLWQNYFKGLSLRFVARNLNRELYW